MFKKAEKTKQKIRCAIVGAAGSGKTYSALILAQSMSNKRIAVLDTEHGSASLYADRFEFDVCELKPAYTPENYIKAINTAEDSGEYDVLIIDSLSHEWNGKGGILEIVDKLGGGYTAWGKVNPRHNSLINAILTSPLHIIATMRTKTAYEVGKDEKGKMTVEKKGTVPIQREDVDSEFTVVFDLNQNHMARATKDRTSLFDGKDFVITSEIGLELINCLSSGKKPNMESLKEIANLLKSKGHEFLKMGEMKTILWDKYSLTLDDINPENTLLQLEKINETV